jgi:hypothetical protein
LVQEDLSFGITRGALLQPHVWTVLEFPPPYDGRPSPRETVQKDYGSILIAHSELSGYQNATGALAQGERAAEQVTA